MLSREAVAAALALAGVRSGACVLDLAPAAGLTRAARAAAGENGRVDGGDVPPDPLLPEVRYSYGLAVWPDESADRVVEHAESASDRFTPYARVTLGSAGSLVHLVDRLRERGWTVLHGTTIRDGDLALAVARVPEEPLA